MAVLDAVIALIFAILAEVFRTTGEELWFVPLYVSVYFAIQAIWRIIRDS